MSRPVGTPQLESDAQWVPIQSTERLIQLMPHHIQEKILRYQITAAINERKKLGWNTSSFNELFAAERVRASNELGWTEVHNELLEIFENTLDDGLDYYVNLLEAAWERAQELAEEAAWQARLERAQEDPAAFTRERELEKKPLWKEKESRRKPFPPERRRGGEAVVHSVNYTSSPSSIFCFALIALRARACPHCLFFQGMASKLFTILRSETCLHFFRPHHTFLHENHNYRNQHRVALPRHPSPRSVVGRFPESDPSRGRISAAYRGGCKDQCLCAPAASNHFWRR